jgi:hypothetical protein
MVRVAVLAVAMLTMLSGCDILSLAGIGGNQSDNASANQSAGSKDPVSQNVQIADAGVTSSRSLQPLSANMSQDAAKDPSSAATFHANMLLGRWGDYGDCTKNVIDFAGDGTFRSADGSVGHWELSGDQLTFSGAGGEIRVRLESLQGDRLTIVQADGSRGQSQRC